MSAFKSVEDGEKEQPLSKPQFKLPASKAPKKATPMPV